MSAVEAEDFTNPLHAVPAPKTAAARDAGPGPAPAPAPAPAPLEPPSSDPRVVAFREILSRVPASEVEAVLSRCGLAPLPEVVEAVLRQSYASPATAVRFFRWSGLKAKHTAGAWNLMVDVLGKNALFEPMWDAIRSMRQEPGALSVATFASAFSSYCSLGRVKEAVMTFDVMDRYGVPQDVVAVNSLLSALCRADGRTADAAAFFDRVKSKIPPDADTFAILLEGWQKEGNAARAKTTFGEMVVRVGWSDAFLSTLVRGGLAEEAVKFLKVMKGKGRLPGLKFFSSALDILVEQNDHAHALALWAIMVLDGGLVPNLAMYNAMIALLCGARDVNSAFRLLDEMPFHCAFPDSLTYNTIFDCLLRNRMPREAHSFFKEMRKNEQLPSSPNCIAAIRMFFNEFDPTAALELWNCVLEENFFPPDDCANELLLGLCDLGRLGEVRKYAEDMLDREVELRPSTMEKMKTAFHKAGKLDSYDRLARRMRHY
ncbi:pentatricopeptide repeat-containing protein At1g77360, mitochondrial-like [Ananas comosus]|uniref:Pentatricopeptide repeat-containing protein At1g77360, mitochondrial-like n=1 Tax=Ananas comosus TaxID=4615 RepID=A0A6P5FIG6_ANACO|nr:pentatricopeptide repeat-containing protein At1g77360, mitochondrial-like [Ananas comosus]XP_020093258.1 pentatricopeptide repeat-containing protein At1g77360, mitochondrial-like [Ananas comosus]XP_020093259.1 pentatricopeptide repeat-containing protein At1g77360, mitochondrial-like [Ananas comosus]